MYDVTGRSLLHFFFFFFAAARALLLSGTSRAQMLEREDATEASEEDNSNAQDPKEKAREKAREKTARHVRPGTNSVPKALTVFQRISRNGPESGRNLVTEN